MTWSAPLSRGLLRGGVDPVSPGFRIDGEARPTIVNGRVKRGTPEDTKTASPDGRVATTRLSLIYSASCGVGGVPLPDKDTVTIGRTSDADVVIGDPSVSRLHARLGLRGEFFVEDLDSTNGTRILGRRLEPGERAPVQLGTVIELGAATLILQRTAHPVQAPSAPADDTMGRVAPRRATADTPVLANPTMQRLYALLDVFAPSHLNILILGETGVGKEVFAEAIHRASTRAGQRFLQLNCAALPESVLEGELFGYEKGAFTGATAARAGLFESASGGTVFLDEIGEMPLGIQAKLLRVLESGEVLRLGSRTSTRVDLRFVAATNRDPRAMIAERTFRTDLFFRLNGMTVTIPPLRTRPEDLLPLARRFLASACARLGRPAVDLHPSALAALETYGWPGNVRELRNLMDRAATFCRQDVVTREILVDAAPELFDLPLTAPAPEPTLQLPPSIAPAAMPMEMPAPPPADASGSLASSVEALERGRILEALTLTHGNQTRAAEHLGMTRRALIHRLETYGIGRPRKASKSK